MDPNKTDEVIFWILTPTLAEEIRKSLSVLLIFNKTFYCQQVPKQHQRQPLFFSFYF